MGTTGCTFKLKHRKENMPNGMSGDSVKEKYGGIMYKRLIETYEERFAKDWRRGTVTYRSCC